MVGRTELLQRRLDGPHRQPAIHRGGASRATHRQLNRCRRDDDEDPLLHHELGLDRPPRDLPGGGTPAFHARIVHLAWLPTRARRNPSHPPAKAATGWSGPAVATSQKYQAAAGVSSLATTGPITVCEPTQRKHVFGLQPKWSPRPKANHEMVTAMPMPNVRTATVDHRNAMAAMGLPSGCVHPACWKRVDAAKPAAIVRALSTRLRSRQSCVAKGAGRSAGR
jgi:hypothetical protein